MSGVAIIVMGNDVDDEKIAIVRARIRDANVCELTDELRELPKEVASCNGELQRCQEPIIGMTGAPGS
jgi:hypothetical protein